MVEQIEAQRGIVTGSNSQSRWVVEFGFKHGQIQRWSPLLKHCNVAALGHYWVVMGRIRRGQGRNEVAQGIEDGHRFFATLPFKKWSLI